MSFQQLTVILPGASEVGACALTSEILREFATMGEDASALNRITWRAGAGNYSEATILMRAPDVSVLLGAATNTVTIKIGDFSDSNRQVFCNQMYLLEPRPVHVGINDSLYAVRFVDARYFWKGIAANHAYNVTTTWDRNSFYTQSESGGTTPYTWAQIITGLLGDLNLSSDCVNNLDMVTGTATPNDFLMDNEPVGEMLDRVLAIFGAVLVAYPTPGGSGKRYLIDYVRSFNQNALKTNDAFLSERTAGGVVYDAGNISGTGQLLNNIMPCNVTIKFPRQIPATAGDYPSSSDPPPMRQFKTLTSDVGIPSGLTGRIGYTAIVNDALWAIGPIGSETNLTALQARADAISTAYYQRWKLAAINCRTSGVINPLPIAGTVEWHHTATGVYTDVHSLRDLLRDADDTGRFYSLGNIQTWKTFDGATVISDNTPGIMPLPGSITASSGGPTSFAYTASTYTGTTLVTVRNGAEPFDGSPGKLGITISSSGTTSGGCTVKAIGVGYETLFWPDPTVAGGFMFSVPNSGEP